MSNAKFQADILNEIEDLGPSKIDSTIQTLPKRFREKSESLAGRGQRDAHNRTWSYCMDENIILIF